MKITTKDIPVRMPMLKQMSECNGWRLDEYSESMGFINLYHPEYNIFITVCMINMTVGIVYPGMRTVWKKGVTDSEIEYILSNPMLYV